MRPRPLATATAAALVVGAVVGPALAFGTASSSAQSAAGTATSGVTLFSVSAGGHSISVGTVTLSSDTVAGSPVASVTVTPVTADGTAYGEKTVTPAGSPYAFGGVSAPAALNGLATVQSPMVSTDAGTAGGPSSHASTTSLGSVTLLGLPVALNGGLTAGSSVNEVTGATGTKTVTLSNLALPSIADILAAEGLDLTKLPESTLATLMSKLGLVTSAITTAEAALASAQAPIAGQVTAANAAISSAASAVAAAGDDLAAKTAVAKQAAAALSAASAASTTADSAVTTANAAVSAAQTALTAKLAAIPPAVLAVLPAGANSIAGYALLTPLQKASVDAAVPNTSTTYATYVGSLSAQTAAVSNQASALSAKNAAQTASNVAAAAQTAAQAGLTAAQAALATAQSTLAGLLVPLTAQINAVVTAITGKLATTPLVSLDKLAVTTRASAITAAANGQDAEVVGGTISGLKVAGTDVLSTATGMSSLNVLDLIGSTLGQVQAAVTTVTGTLSSVLSTVPGLPTLAVPAPKVDLLTQSTATSVKDGFGLANVAVHALTVTLPAFSIPGAVALPNAASLPAMNGLAATPAVPTGALSNLVSIPTVLGFGTVSENAKYRPAVVAAPGTTTPGTTTPGTTTPGTTTPGTTTPGTTTPGTTGSDQLPKTGLPTGIALISVALAGGGLLLRRRLAGIAG